MRIWIKGHVGDKSARLAEAEADIATPEAQGRLTGGHEQDAMNWYLGNFVEHPGAARQAIRALTPIRLRRCAQLRKLRLHWVPSAGV